MTFGELLKNWNGGLTRGAQTRFAERIGVAPNTVSQWVRGVSRPADDLRSKVAGELRIGVEKLEGLFTRRPRPAPASWEAGPAAWASGPEAYAALRELPPPYATARPQPSPAWLDVPVHGVISGEKLEFNFWDNVPEEYLPMAIKGPENARYGALRIQGESLSFLGGAGDYLLIAQPSALSHGRWAIIRHQGEILLKRVHFKKGRLELSSGPGKAKKAWDVDAQELELLGVVVGKYSKL